jgi:hypothetical protein
MSSTFSSDPGEAPWSLTPDTVTGQPEEREMNARVKWIIRVLAGIGAGMMLLTGAGYLLPDTHTATRTLVLQAPVRAVWDRVSDLGSAADWQPGVKSVRQDAPLNGHPVWVQDAERGELPLEVVESRAPSLLVTRIAPEAIGAADLGFGGTWTWDVGTNDLGTTVTITEEGVVANPVYRVMTMLAGTDATIQGTLEALAASFGEEVVWAQ